MSSTFDKEPVQGLDGRREIDKDKKWGEWRRLNIDN